MCGRGHLLQIDSHCTMIVKVAESVSFLVDLSTQRYSPAWLLLMLCILRELNLLPSGPNQPNEALSSDGLSSSHRILPVSLLSFTTNGDALLNVGGRMKAVGE